MFFFFNFFIELLILLISFIFTIFFFRVPNIIPSKLAFVTIVYKFLYDLALDLFDKPNVSTSVLSQKSPSLSRQTSSEPQVSSIIYP